MTRKPFITAFLLAFIEASAGAEITVYPAAKISIPSVSVAESARASALGEAFTAVDGDLAALQWNPAGLSSLDMPQFCGEGNLWNPEQQMFQFYLAYGQNLHSGGLAFSLKALSLGNLEKRSRTGEWLESSGGNFDLSGMVGWGVALGEHWQLGVMGEYSRESMPGSEIQMLDAGVGFQYQPWKEIGFGASAMRFGWAPPGSQPPLALNFGAVARLLQNKLMFTADYQHPLADFPAIKAGVEWTALGSLSLRAGWRQRLNAAAADLLSGPTAGLGFLGGQAGDARENWIGMDYAVVPNLAWGTLVHRVSLNFLFPAGFFSTTQVRGPAAAKEAYEQGLKLLGRGRKIDALVAFKTSLQADPATSQAGPYVDQIVKELENSGPSGNPEVEKLIRRYAENGLNYFKAGQWKQAIDQWEFALAVDKKNAEILKNIRAAREKMDQITSDFKEKAAKALEHGDIIAAVRDYREAGKINPDDKDVKARLQSLRPSALKEIKRLHREGIELYVTDKPKEALEMWKQALDLDPDDPEGTLKRDIYKAKKMIELRE